MPPPRGSSILLCALYLLLGGGAFGFLDGGSIDFDRLPATFLADYLAFEAQAGNECAAMSMHHRQAVIALDRIAREWNMAGVDWRTDGGSHAEQDDTSVLQGADIEKEIDHPARTTNAGGANIGPPREMPREVTDVTTGQHHEAAAMTTDNTPVHHLSGTNASRFLTDNADGDCPSTCFGASCEGWTNTCSELENAYGCDCGGCVCPTAPLIIIMSSESGTASVATFESLQGAMLNATRINT